LPSRETWTERRPPISGRSTPVTPNTARMQRITSGVC
jgi:hypothetical protein